MKHLNMADEFLRLRRLSKLRDPLEKIASVINFEQFRPLLMAVFASKAGELGGRPPYDCVLMFKILLLQQWYNIADDKTEYLINDRLSFQRFLGLTLSDTVPDAKTIWAFREKLNKNGLERQLFEFFGEQLDAKALITRTGSIVDATFVDAPRQRNKRAENEEIKEGKTPEEWFGVPNKLRQKDADARWAKKNDETHYGYKDHAKVDKDSKLIVDYVVTAASVHDSQKLVELVDEKDNVLFGDSAFTSEALHRELLEKYPHLVIKIHEKGYRNKPLTEEQKASNTEKSRIRARVEHVFGIMHQKMCGLFIRCIGISRANGAIGLKNLAYNLDRYRFLQKVPVKI